MSDTTLLANQYAASAEFLKKVNTALLEVKRAQFGTKVGGATEGGLRRSRDLLAQLVEAVQARLENRSIRQEVVPEELVERLRGGYGTELSWKLQDLKEAIAELRSDSVMSARALGALDELCEAADATASESFRRLWRR